MADPMVGAVAVRAATNGTWAERHQHGHQVDADAHPAHALPEELMAPPPPPKPMVAGLVPELKPDTPMQKVVLPGLADLTLGNVVVPGRFDPYRIAGFVTRLQDVPAGSSAELARRYGLNLVPGWPDTPELYVLRFYAHSPELYIAPFERSVYQIDLLELPAGAELWRIDAEGGELRVGAYLNRQVGWVSTAPVRLGPGRWNQPPVSLQPTVRRGLIARFRGEDFDADFGPRPGEVTLHPLPGSQPPADFAEQAGTFTLAARICEVESLELVRWRAGWRGLPVELVESWPQQAVIHYIGENGPRASEFGLAEVDYRVWRGSVPHSELTDVQRQCTPLSRDCSTTH
ncbi:MAG: hypothetical protein ACRDSP_16475 [Pseudonocardiaceae bacterium]